MHSVQGVYYLEIENHGVLAVTHGYTDRNASILDENGAVLRTANLGESTPAYLLADVASDGRSLWWTDYRNERLFVSDFALELQHSVQMPADTGTLVGITYVPELDAMLVQRRQQPVDLFLIDAQPPFDVATVAMPFGYADQYDVTYADGCVFMVERSNGRILMVTPSELRQGTISEQVLIEGLERPQHAAVVDGKLYVIETAAYRVSVLDLASGQRTLYPLPNKRIKRGLTVTPDGEVWVTGFFDPDDSIRESNTGLIRMNLAD